MPTENGSHLSDCSLWRDEGGLRILRIPPCPKFWCNQQMLCPAPKQQSCSTPLGAFPRTSQGQQQHIPPPSPRPSSARTPDLRSVPRPTSRCPQACDIRQNPRLRVLVQLVLPRVLVQPQDRRIVVPVPLRELCSLDPRRPVRPHTSFWFLVMRRGTLQPLRPAQHDASALHVDSVAHRLCAGAQLPKPQQSCATHPYLFVPAPPILS
mmetsp:Transcript_47128/g.111936  ORF Transcript_47128/g.111936 Transcript_47128/m.111936 type:complete len:208 (+) Transcript_47128:403-1026(+)